MKMGYPIDTLPPPPPYTPQEPSSSCQNTIPSRTSDYHVPMDTEIHRVPTELNITETILGAAPNIRISTIPSAPPDLLKNDLEDTIKKLLKEACNNKNGCRFLIKQSKHPIVLYESWFGRKIQLNNHHENIIIHGSISSHDSIRLENTRGNITVDGSLVAGKNIHVKISQGTLILNGLCMVSKDIITIENSDSPLQLTNMIEAKRLYIRTKNAPLVMNQISLRSDLYIRASKSSIEIYIVDIKNSSAKIKIETSRAFINVYLSSQFSGEFEIESKKGAASIIDRTGSGTLLFKKIEKYHLSGTFVKEKRFKHSIFIKTSNAPATIHII